MQNYLQAAHKFINRLARADIVFFILPPLMTLLFLGTVAQREIGLYEAHQTFFASFIIWAGPLPLPGGYLLIALLSISLSLKFFLKSVWSWNKAGINLTHLGVLVLLIGGLITALQAQESYMLIPEGEKTPYIYDYHQRELAIFLDSKPHTTFPFESLKQNQDINLPFSLRVLDYCDNCKIIRRTDAAETLDEKLQSLAVFMALSKKPGEKAPEENIAGLTFEITGIDENQDGLYIAFEGMPKPVEIKQGDRTYHIVFGKTQSTLPFSIHLDDFQKQTYPGLDKAREYLSDVIVIDGELKWPVRIAMNEPLRYKGYTFYQSSFEQTEAGEITLLSVVQNRGWLLPYIGTTIITLGLLLHIFMTLRGRQS